MNRKDSILYRTTNDNENSVTELLCNLMREKYVRDILLLNLKIEKHIVDGIKFEDIRTQSSCDEGGRPDICIQNKNTLIYIENKIYSNTVLTECQTTTYPQKLTTTGENYKQMIFLVPKEYNHEGEINRIQEEYKTCRIGIVKWEEFLFEVSKFEIGESNLIFKECFRYFEDKLLSKSVSVKFTPKDIAIMYNTKDLVATNDYFFKLHRVIELTDIIIIKKLGSNGFSHSNWIWEGNLNKKGKYINYSVNNNSQIEKIFIGLNFDIAKDETKHPDSLSNSEFLFSLAIKNDIIFDRISKLPKTIDRIFYEEWYYIKIDKHTITDDDVCEALANYICEILSALFL